jgi:hypothetical protein
VQLAAAAYEVRRCFFRGRPVGRDSFCTRAISDSSMIHVFPTFDARIIPRVIIAATRRGLTFSIFAASVVPIAGIDR